jgi:hypothetical protein
MKRNTRILLALSCLLPFCMAVSSFAQQPAPAARGARPAPQPIPLFFRENWKDTPGVPAAQTFVSNADLELKLYGPSKSEIENTNEGLPHIWTGGCSQTCALALKHKESYVDLTGKAKMRWLTKTSGFHEIRPIVKLADGTWLVGDHVDADTFDFNESEFYFSQMHWLKLDIEKVVTKGTLLDKVDLSKVDEIGFTDLMPGSGHGTGGYSDVAWIEVYGKPVKRDGTEPQAKAAK